MADRKLSITIVGDATKAKKALGDLDKAVGKSEQQTKKSSSGIKSNLATFGIGAALFGAAKAADESAKVMAQTEAVIKSTGNAANITADEVADLAGELSAKSGVDDEAIQSGSNLIATFKNIKNEAGEGNDIFNQVTEAALDMSVAMGTDMTSASMMLGKALNDPTAGLSKLTRSGVQFTEQQKEQITAMQAAGDMAGAQKIMLAELESQFGGSAEAQATAMGKAQVSIDNLAESLGGVLMPVVAQAADGLGFLADGLGALPQPAQTAIVSAGLAGIAWAKWGENITDLGSTMKAHGGTIKKYVQGIDGAKAANIGFATAAGGGALLAIYGVTKGMEDSARMAAKYEADIDSLRDAMVEGATPAQALGDHLTDIWTDKASLFMDQGIESVGDLNNLISMSDAEFAAWQGTLDGTADSMFGVGHTVEAMRDQFSSAREEVKLNAEAVADLAEEMGPLSFAQDIAEGAAEGQATALTNLRDRSEEAGQAIRDFYDDTTSGLQSTIDVEAAIDDLTESFKENGATFDINEEKGRANTEALIDAKDAAVDAALKIREQTGSSDEAARSLEGYTGRLKESARAAGFTEDEIKFMIAQMKLTPTDIRTTVHSNATAQESAFGRLGVKVAGVMSHKHITVTESGSSAVITAMSSVQQAIARIQATNAISVAFAGIRYPGRADGGPVTAGQPYLVGEEGPEVVTFPRSGTVHDAPTTRRMMSGGGPPMPMGGSMGGGGDTHLHIHAGTIVTESQLADLVTKVLKDKQGRTGTRKILAGVA